MTERPLVFLRSPIPGEVELCVTIEGDVNVVKLTHQQLWRVVSDGMHYLSRWPIKQQQDAKS